MSWLDSLRGRFGFGTAVADAGAPTCYTIAGHAECPYFRKAVCVANKLAEKHAGQVSVKVVAMDRSQWKDELPKMTQV